MASSYNTEKKIFYAKDRKAWRKWLEKNFEKENNIWLKLHKKNSPTPSPTYAEAVEEALCFGWIDSKPNKLDEESFVLFFSKRKPRSPWSAINKKRIEVLIEKGLMTSTGLAKIEEAKKDGSWDMLNSIDNLELPADLKKAFKSNKIAEKNFNAFSPSSRKAILWWITSAKTKETRDKRINETVSLAAQNKVANQYVRKKE